MKVIDLTLEGDEEKIQEINQLLNYLGNKSSKFHQEKINEIRCDLEEVCAEEDIGTLSFDD